MGLNWLAGRLGGGKSVVGGCLVSPGRDSGAQKTSLGWERG